VLLELFNYNAKTNALGDRIDLIETETFQG
jgi:hypothetical protein